MLGSYVLFNDLTNFNGQDNYGLSEIRFYSKYRPQACGDPGTVYHDGDFTGAAGQQDCYVDEYDLNYLAGQWFGCTDPCGIGCQVIEQIQQHRITAGTVTVDGDLTEWADAEWFDLDQVYYGSPNDISIDPPGRPWP